MKKFILIIFLTLLGITSQSQTVGDHLNFIKESRPGGELKLESDSRSYVVVEKTTKTIIVYFFDETLICYTVVLVPPNPSQLQSLISSFNSEWVVVDDTTWKFYRKDMTILKCVLKTIDDVGPAFLIGENK